MGKIEKEMYIYVCVYKLNSFPNLLSLSMFPGFVRTLFHYVLRFLQPVNRARGLFFTTPCGLY